MSSTARLDPPTYSIAVRLTLFFVVFFGVVVFIGGAALYQVVTRHVASELDGDIARDMDEFVRVVRQDSPDALRDAFASYEKASGKNNGFARLVDRQGRVVVSTNMTGWRDMPLPAAGQEGSDTARFTTVALPDARHEARLLSMPVGRHGDLQIGVSLQGSDLLATHFKRYGFVILVLILVLGAPVGWWLARRAVAGIEEVTRTARSVADGHFSDRVEVSGHGREIDGLVRSFNLMVERVQSVMGEMRHVNDNIAHDLRSPLARIRGLAERAVLDGESCESAGAIVEECDRLMQMINTMLDISEAEAGIGRLQLDEVDVQQLIGQAVELFSDVADERGVRLEAGRMAAPLTIRGDLRKIQRALANLIDNAIKYTPDGGRVRIDATRIGDKLEIAVSDTGIGIAAENLPRIFERFFRADESRHLVGNGLGLSLAQAVAKVHGGGISAESRLGEGSIFKLILPLHSA